MGYVGGVMLILVAHTVCNVGGTEVIRIMSARKATKREKKYYERTH